MKNYKRLFLIDGDSFIYKALNGIQSLKEGDRVLIFVTTEGLARRLKTKGYIRQNVAVIMVTTRPSIITGKNMEYPQLIWT